MSNVNFVLISGNLVKNAELRSLPSGLGVLTFRLASTRRGKETEDTCFIDVDLFKDMSVATTLLQYLNKGKAIFVQGRLVLDQWKDKQGEAHQKIKIIGDKIEFIGAKDTSSEGE